MDNIKKAKRLGILGFALCGLCCALPVIGTLIGVASLTGIAIYLEKIVLVILGLAALILGYAWYTKRKSAKNRKTCSCNTACGCKAEGIA